MVVHEAEEEALTVQDGVPQWAPKLCLQRTPVSVGVRSWGCLRHLPVLSAFPVCFCEYMCEYIRA